MIIEKDVKVIGIIYYIILAAIPIMLDNNVINLKTILKQIRSKIYEIPHISNYIMLQII